MKSVTTLSKIKTSLVSTQSVKILIDKCYEAINDDLDTPSLLANLFDIVRYINSINDGKEGISKEDLSELIKYFNAFVFDILGLKDETTSKSDEKLTGELMKIIIGLRQDAKDKKEWAASDKIREDLRNAGIILKDTKEGADWEKG